MELVVKKFGGTSVGDIARIRNVARLIEEYRRRHPNEQVVAVVSAMSGETNKLVALAKSCVAKPEPRELDVLLATGEQVTIALLSMALIERGIPARSLLGLQAKIETEGKHTNAHISGIESDAVREVLEQGMVPVVAGFQGVDHDGNVTTLGRGGSDITAVALAAALRAKACYIYTDVTGVFSTDPRLCPRAALLSRVCHEEMLEMASLGAKVLHPRSVYFAMRYEVPLAVLSTFTAVEDLVESEESRPLMQPGRNGTWVVREEELMEKPVVTGITYRLDEAKLTVSKLPKGIHSLSGVFGLLAAEEILVDMITQTGYVRGLTDLSFTVPDESSARALEVVQAAIPELGAEGASIERDISKVSVVGVGMKYHAGVAARMFDTLAAENIEVQMISTSEIKISVIVPRKYCEVAVRVLHDAFVHMRPEIGKEIAA